MNISNQRVAALILAAGRSTRMRGRDKLLCEIDNVPLLRQTSLAALESKCHHVTIVISPEQKERIDVIRDLPMAICMTGNSSAGMSASLASGIVSLPQSLAGFVILLGDMPEIGAYEINAVIDNFRDGNISAGAADGKRGHPVCFPSNMKGEFLKLAGDQGARDIISKYTDRLSLVDLHDNHARLDLNTPEDWTKYLAHQTSET